MRLAVAGAGIQGASIALELARRGHAVDLYEREPAPLQRASRSNEGKLHLGFVYGNDPSLRTARIVQRGSMRFWSIVNRWLDFSVDRVPCSTPFFYAVHRETLVGIDGIARHFGQVAELYRGEQANPEARYLGLEFASPCEPLAPRELEAHFDPASVIAAWRTVERSVDPRALAELYRAALAAEPRITLHCAHEVRRASPSGGSRIELEIAYGGEVRREVYDQVANACWEGRLALDATYGLTSARRWLHRYKLGTWLEADGGAPVPSVTIVLGPFGDVADFGDRIYLSWYPACLAGVSGALAPPDWDAQITAQQREAALERSLAALGGIVPPLRRLGGARVAESIGGVITAWGASGIDDPGSELHTRHDIGVQSYGGYHSVNTGRYCTAPLFALETCDRILGRL